MGWHLAWVQRQRLPDNSLPNISVPMWDHGTSKTRRPFPACVCVCVFAAKVLQASEDASLEKADHLTPFSRGIAPPKTVFDDKIARFANGNSLSSSQAGAAWILAGQGDAGARGGRKVKHTGE